MENANEQEKRKVHKPYMELFLEMLMALPDDELEHPLITFLEDS